MTDWSLAEIRALATKAARGAGLDWGLAEEAGYAVSWLEARCAPGTQALASWLEAVGEVDKEICPIRIGTALMDCGEAPENGYELTVFQPLLLAPFLVPFVESGVSYALNWPQAGFTLQKDGLVLGEDSHSGLPTGSVVCSWTRVANAAKTPDCRTRVPESAAEAVEILTKFAAKTYAPATEASRISGAGAGLSDND